MGKKQVAVWEISETGRTTEIFRQKILMKRKSLTLLFASSDDLFWIC